MLWIMYSWSISVDQCNTRTIEMHKITLISMDQTKIADPNNAAKVVHECKELIKGVEKVRIHLYISLGGRANKLRRVHGGD